MPYTTIASLQNILIFRSTAIGAELMHRDADGNWPERPLAIEAGLLELKSIDFGIELPAIYRATRLARG